MAYRVSKEQFEQIVEEALRDLPQQFADFLEEVPIEIRDRPTSKMLESLGLTEDELLLGLYTGTSVDRRSVQHDFEYPNVIFIFQEDLEIASDSKEQLESEIRKTVLHEIGHHFGLDEDDLDRLGYG